MPTRTRWKCFIHPKYTGVHAPKDDRIRESIVRGKPTKCMCGAVYKVEENKRKERREKG
jgi:hypothetical protein